MVYILPHILDAQHTLTGTCREDISTYTERIYGPNDYLLQGRRFVYHNRKANGHPYFNTTEWKNAVIYSNGRSYREMTIQYDLENDKFIFQVIHQLGKTDFIYAEDRLIDSLRFDDHLFLNIRKISDSIQSQGYYESVFCGNSLYVLKHSKQFINTYNTVNPYGTYSKQVSVLYIVRGNELTACPAKKDFLRYFELYKKEIRRFARQNHIYYRKAGEDDFVALCRYADELTGTKK